MKAIKLKDWEKDKIKCPKCRNKLFFNYGTNDDGISESIRCTYCLSDFEFNDKDAFIIVDFYKNKVENFDTIINQK